MDFMRRLFCKHEYLFIKEVHVYETMLSLKPCKANRIYICPKCLKKRVIKY